MINADCFSLWMFQAVFKTCDFHEPSDRYLTLPLHLYKQNLLLKKSRFKKKSLSILKDKNNVLSDFSSFNSLKKKDLKILVWVGLDVQYQVSSKFTERKKYISIPPLWNSPGIICSINTENKEIPMKTHTEQHSSILSVDWVISGKQKRCHEGVKWYKLWILFQ